MTGPALTPTSLRAMARPSVALMLLAGLISGTAICSAKSPREQLKGFAAPVQGDVVAKFGDDGNEGIDIAVPAGTSVKAANDGVVIYAGKIKGLGNTVFIEHAEGFLTIYAHNEQLIVKAGDRVSRGQIIADSGSGGGVNAPELYFEIRHGAEPIDPTSLFSASHQQRASPVLGLPVKGGKIITSYGPKHGDGIDFAVPDGTPVRAAADGVVAYSGNELKGYGNLILVRHADGLTTAYAHASELLVKRGDQVHKGQVIAKSGHSGEVASPQLHFEVREGMTPVDPRDYLPGGVEKQTTAASTPDDDPKQGPPPLAQFPWPPPKSSASYVLPDSVFKDQATVGKAVAAITAALEQTGYAERSFFKTGDNGVVMVTRLEHIKEDGFSFVDPNRWATPEPSLNAANLADFFRGLFFVPPGHYRVIAFVFQDHAFAQSSEVISKDDALSWLHSGANVLPPDVASTSFREAHCTVLIYEFSSDGRTAPVIESHLTGKQHLERAGVLPALGDTK